MTGTTTRAPHANTPAAAQARSRRGFTLTELLVVMLIIVLMIGLIAAATSAARVSQKKQLTRVLITKLDAILRQHLSTCTGRNVVIPDRASLVSMNMTPASYRSWFIRRNVITGDLPCHWSDVAVLAASAAASPNILPLTLPQKTYAAIWNAALRKKQQILPGEQGYPIVNVANPTDEELELVIGVEHDIVSLRYAGAECLFMAVMQGGISDCLECGELRGADRGDKDGDGAFEFWDTWGNPIGFMLWPAGLQLPPGAGTAFFTSQGRTLEQAFPPEGIAPSPSLGMRPLIYSAGPDGKYGLSPFGPYDITPADWIGNLAEGAAPVGRSCGDWAVSPTSFMAIPEGTVASDNITNLDAEASR
jgi:prepilin-type N-terminal cleavage/methylation domain-containing protein